MPVLISLAISVCSSDLDRRIGRRGKHRDWSGRDSYRGSFSTPPLIGGIVVLVGYFDHNYLMPPFHCLGASSFLPFFGSMGSRGIVGAGTSGRRLLAVQGIEGSINGQRVDYSAIIPPA